MVESKEKSKAHLLEVCLGVCLIRFSNLLTYIAVGAVYSVVAVVVIPASFFTNCIPLCLGALEVYSC